MLMIQNQDKHIYFEESKIKLKFKIAYVFAKYVLYNGPMYATIWKLRYFGSISLLII